LKIILIYLPHPYLARPGSHAPLGLMYIASSLENKGIDVEIRNYTSFTTEGAIADLPEADVYGISVTSLELLQANRFAFKIKEKYFSSVVGLGGPGTYTEEYVDFDIIDFICKGDGEYTILDILSDIKKKDIKKIYDGKTVKNIDNLSFPARHLLSTDSGGNIFAYNKKYQKGGSTMIVSSRGCPFKCSFCCAPHFTNSNCGVRYRDPENVYLEIKKCIEVHNIKEFKFCDEMFTSRKERVMKICDLIGNMDISWKASVRVKPFDYEIAKVMKESGCKEVSFGIESFDNNVLRVLNKKTTDIDNANALEISDSAGLKSRVLFMIRTPGQTDKTVPINIHWLEKVPYHIIACTSFVPLPGSDTWNNPDKYGIEIINRNLDDYNFYFYAKDDDYEDNIVDLIKIKGRKIEEVNNETFEFRKYLDKTNKVNKG